MSTLRINHITPYSGDTVYIDGILESQTITNLSQSLDARIIAATNEQDLTSFETIANVSALSSSIASQQYSKLNSNNTFNGNQTITGSLYVSQNLIVQGSSSIQTISSSTLNIGTSLITVNVQNPASRFGGFAVIDSGSSPLRSGSLLFDATENEWIFVHQSETTTTSSLLIMGPRTFNAVGDEIHPTNNRLMKSIYDEHIGDSNISDNGTTITMLTNTDITGSLKVTSTISASTFTGVGNLTLFSSSVDARFDSLQSATSSYEIKGRGIISGSSQLTTAFDARYLNINGDSVVSGSSQITLSSTNGFNTFSSSIATSIANIPQIPFTEVISKTSVSNPSNYTLYSFPTASYNGAKLVFVATERSGGETPSNRSTTYEILIAQGNGLVSNIQTYQIKSQSTSPAPTITTVISNGNVLVRVTESGTFNYSGYIQLF